MGAIDARWMTTGTAAGDWETAFEAYRKSREAAKKLEEDYAGATAEIERELETRFDALVSDWSDAMETLLFLEAPTFEAVATKARIVADDAVSDLVIAPAVAQTIAEDLERLAA